MHLFRYVFDYRWKSDCNRPPLCEIRDNMGAIHGVWTVFFLVQNRGHFNLPCLNFYGKFEVDGYWTRARCNFVQFLQG